MHLITHDDADYSVTSAEGLFMDSDMHARLAELVLISSEVQRVDDMAREYHRATDILHEEEGEGVIRHEVHRAADRPGRTCHHHHRGACGGKGERRSRARRCSPS